MHAGIKKISFLVLSLLMNCTKPFIPNLLHRYLVFKLSFKPIKQSFKSSQRRACFIPWVGIVPQFITSKPLLLNYSLVSNFHSYLLISDRKLPMERTDEFTFLLNFLGIFLLFIKLAVLADVLIVLGMHIDFGWILKSVPASKMYFKYAELVPLGKYIFWEREYITVLTFRNRQHKGMDFWRLKYHFNSFELRPTDPTMWAILWFLWKAKCTKFVGEVPMEFYHMHWFQKRVVMEFLDKVVCNSKLLALSGPSYVMNKGLWGVHKAGVNAKGPFWRGS